MIKIVQTSIGLNPSFEVVRGKRLYKEFLEKVGYSRTSTLPIYNYNPVKFVNYGVLLFGDILYLDYNTNQDLVLVTKIDKNILKSYKGKEKELVEMLLTKEFNKLRK